jgi:hypothetical protein
MSIKIGDKIRLATTQEEGVVLATSTNTPNCVAVRFGNSFAYLIPTKELDLIATPTSTRNHSWLIRRPLKRR